MDRYSFQIYRYAIVVCRNQAKKYLCVKENLNKGWWLPGGKVKIGETFMEAAIRECKEETLITPQIKGIIRVDTGKYYTQNVIRLDENADPKSIADSESNCAKFLKIEEIENMKKQWRSPQIYQFPHYLQQGGIISPMSAFKENFNDQF